MKTLVLIDAVHTLISRDRVDLALALLRKMLKQIAPELYRQVVQISWRYSYARTQEMEGQISPDEAMRQRNQLAHALLDLTESIYRQLPETLDKGAAETATALLDAISDLIQPAPEDLRLIGNAPEDKQKPPRGSTAVGMLLLFLSALAMLGGMMRAERASLDEQRAFIVALADAYHITNPGEGYAHLALEKDQLGRWTRLAGIPQGQEKVREDFAALSRSLEAARQEGREILTREDWFVLSGIYPDVSVHFATEKRARIRPAGRNGWRVMEF